jgi:hypothetical protein
MSEVLCVLVTPSLAVPVTTKQDAGIQGLCTRVLAAVPQSLLPLSSCYARRCLTQHVRIERNQRLLEACATGKLLANAHSYAFCKLLQACACAHP